MQPIVFVVFGEENASIKAEVQKRAHTVLEAGRAFFLPWDDATDEAMCTRVQTLKAQILASDVLIDLNELHLIAVTYAHTHDTPSDLMQPISMLRTWFEADFALVHLTLCLQLNESPLFPAFIQQARDFLRGLNNTPSAFTHPVFLLSNRNEYNALHTQHQTHIIEIIVRLPLLISWWQFATHRNTLAQSTNTPMFFTAGISLPHNIPAMPPVKNVSPDAVAAYLHSVPFTPSSIFTLRKLTLAQAEAVLFGDSLLRAFKHFCFNAEVTIEKNATLFSRRVTGWRICSVVDQLARAYALQFRLTFANDASHRHVRIPDATQTPPPTLLLSFLRRDCLQEETIILPHKDGDTRLRIAGNFPIESLALMNYTKRDYPCDLAITDL